MTYNNMDNVPTQVSGSSSVLASDWNTYVRDNFDDIKAGHLTVADSTARTALGTVIVVLGWAVSTTEVVINPFLEGVNNAAYEEAMAVVNSASNDNEVSGPVSSGTNITMPLDSRNFDAQKQYIVGSGLLEVFLNGQNHLPSSIFLWRPWRPLQFRSSTVVPA